MLKLLFEDACDTPSSQLLRVSFNGDNIEFAGGASLLARKITQLLKQNKDLTLLVFVDVSPNNINTVNQYNKLLLKKREKGIEWVNVFFVPIPCIEYFIAKLCYERGYFSDEQLADLVVLNIVKEFKWSILPEELRKISLEKLCKTIFLKRCLRDCMKNTKPKCDIHAKFYLEDCSCEDCVVSDSLKKKAEYLYTTLPIFNVSSQEHEEYLTSLDIITREISIKDMYAKQKFFYGRVCSGMNLKDISIPSDV